MSVNIANYFREQLERPATVLYRQHGDAGWHDVTAAELARSVARWQAALRRAGLVPGDRVALCARNSVNWVAVDLAALGLGLVVVPLYVDDNPENVAWCVADADARLLVVENLRLAHGLVKTNARGGPLPPTVVLRVDADTAITGAVPVERFLPETADEPEFRPLPAATLATLCYTSGTAGRPKGVMLSHGNVIANVTSCRATAMARPDDRFLSMLPLSHMFERTGGYYLPLSLGAEVVFARGIVQLAEDFRTQQPTVVFAVPRIFERLHARMLQSAGTRTLKRRLFDACARHGWRVASGDAGVAERLFAAVLRGIVARPIQDRLGGRLRLAVVGGAALDPALAKVFIGLGITVLHGYGMTEASPVVAVNREDDNVPESVGPPLPGIDVRIGDGGELWIRGGNVMLGYWRNDAATREAIDADGWLHTGDLAEIRDGRIHLRGRAKDIVVLSNGEKVSPQDVELAILRDPVFEQVMLAGEGRPFVVLLAVTPETDEKLLVKRANAQLTSFPRWVRVRRVLASPEPWGTENGMLTPTLKLRRPFVIGQYKDRIDAIYAGTMHE